ncbi:unnamed protein product [Schistocephalus solidus]|uniref:[phosphatase 2A protein]-leucine-carboxy methyltransferase n=1 Tax=Schistocephalus solidus TaxID=70667 RepID=A0A183TGR9_SCHSO|nr:unnamed protein product [Schistocephalus solidus]
MFSAMSRHTVFPNASMDQVQCTNDEATASKAHSIRRGYWVDPYMKYFCPIPSAATPEISRGYFVRVQTFEAMTKRFIQDFNGECQVVNLGAGSDTLFFRLKSVEIQPKVFVEIDLPGNVKKKIVTLRRLDVWEPTNSSSFAVATPESHRSLNAASYHLLSHDLRLPPLSSELPTLFLAECVLVYIPTASSEALIKSLASHFTNAAFINYEQVQTYTASTVLSSSQASFLRWKTVSRGLEVDTNAVVGKGKHPVYASQTCTILTTKTELSRRLAALNTRTQRVMIDPNTSDLLQRGMQ